MSPVPAFRCETCGGVGVSHVVQRGDGQQILFCADCGMGRIEHLPRSTAGFYDDDYYHRAECSGPGYADYRFTATHTLLWVKLVIERLLPAAGRVLDIGCADGFLLTSLEGPFDCHGIEANSAAAGRAAAQGVRILGADLLAPEVSAEQCGRFDVVTAIATFEHVLSLRNAVAKSLQLLAREGILLFEVPLMSDHADNSEWLNSSYEHISYPTVRGLDHLFAGLGAQLVGFESEITGFSSTYVGAAATDPAKLARIRRIFSAMTRASLAGLDTPDRLLNLSFTVVHSFKQDTERVRELPLLLERYHSPELLTRLTQLWHADRYEFERATKQVEWWKGQASNWKAAYDNLAAVSHGQPASSTEATPRILAVLPYLVRGALSLAVLRDMRRRGFEVTIAWCYDATAQYTADPIEEFRAEGRAVDLVHVAPAELEGVLAEAIRTRGIDLLLQIGAAPLYEHLFALKEAFPSLRVVDTLYNEIGHTTRHFLYERAIDGVIVESEHMRRFIAGRTTKREPGIKVVASGVDLAQFRPGSHFRPAGNLTVGYIGRMSPEKNPIGFIEIAERLVPDFPAVQFTMNGEGPMLEEVRLRVGKSPVRHAIAFGGYAEDLTATLQELSLLVVPSVLDGRPNIIMEANACGVPVVAAPVGGIPEMIENGRNGFLVKPTDIARFRDILGDCSADPAALATMHRTARAVAEAKFDRKAMMEAYARAFKEFTTSPEMV